MRDTNSEEVFMILRIKKTSMDAKQRLNLFITGLFLLRIYIDLMATVAQVVGFNTKITTYLYYGVLWILLFLSIPKILNALSSNVWIGIIAFALFFFVQLIAFPDNKIYLLPESVMDIIGFSPKSLLIVVPYILIGIAVTDIEALAKMLHTGSRIGVVCGAISYLIAISAGQDIHYDDMANAYAICLVVCMLITNYQKNDIYFLILGAFSLILAGTRGPILCVILAVVLRVLLLEKASAKRTLKILGGIVAGIFLMSDYVIALVDMIEDVFEMIGVEELRITDYVRKGMIADSSGRDDYSQLVIENIWKNPIFGHGVGGDRVIIGRSYVHNILLELWASYGLLLGTAIFAWMLYWLVKGIFSKNKALAGIVTALFCAAFVKLFLSSSYLFSKELFLLIGICISGTSLQKYRMCRGNDRELDNNMHQEIFSAN